MEKIWKYLEKSDNKTFSRTRFVVERLKVLNDRMLSAFPKSSVR